RSQGRPPSRRPFPNRLLTESLQTGLFRNRQYLANFYLEIFCLETFYLEIFYLEILISRMPRLRYEYFFPSSSRPAFWRSSGVMAIWYFTLALKVRNQGSANAGIWEGSTRSMTSIAPLFPLCSVK